MKSFWSYFCKNINKFDIGEFKKDKTNIENYLNNTYGMHDKNINDQNIQQAIKPNLVLNSDSVNLADLSATGQLYCNLVYKIHQISSSLNIYITTESFKFPILNGMIESLGATPEQSSNIEHYLNHAVMLNKCMIISCYADSNSQPLVEQLYQMSKTVNIPNDWKILKYMNSNNSFTYNLLLKSIGWSVNDFKYYIGCPENPVYNFCRSSYEPTESEICIVLPDTITSNTAHQISTLAGYLFSYMGSKIGEYFTIKLIPCFYLVVNPDVPTKPFTQLISLLTEKSFNNQCLICKNRAENLDIVKINADGPMIKNYPFLLPNYYCIHCLSILTDLNRLLNLF